MAPAVNEWFDSIFKPNPNDEDILLPVDEDIHSSCQLYAGSLTCFGGDEDFVPVVPSPHNIPGFPQFTGTLFADKALKAVTIAERKARSLARKLCVNRSKIPDEYDGTAYDGCGDKNPLCNSVTIEFVCGPDAKRLFETGEGPSYPPGRPGKKGVLNEEQLKRSKDICGKTISIDCTNRRAGFTETLPGDQPQKQ